MTILLSVITIDEIDTQLCCDSFAFFLTHEQHLIYQLYINFISLVSIMVELRKVLKYII